MKLEIKEFGVRGRVQKTELMLCLREARSSPGIARILNRAGIDIWAGSQASSCARLGIVQILSKHKFHVGVSHDYFPHFICSIISHSFISLGSFLGVLLIFLLSTEGLVSFFLLRSGQQNFSCECFKLCEPGGKLIISQGYSTRSQNFYMFLLMTCKALIMSYHLFW